MLDSCRSTSGNATKSNVNPTVSSQIPGQNEQGIGLGRAGNLINEQGKRITRRPAGVDGFSDGQATGSKPTADRRAVPDRRGSNPITALHCKVANGFPLYCHRRRPVTSVILYGC